MKDQTKAPKRADAKYFANMPDKEIMKAYPKEPSGLNVTLNDQISGIDANQKQRSKKLKGQLKTGY